LRERVTDTRQLYREVCSLMFFRYGITPTANLLYNLVRKDSMGTPGAVLTEFWSELREKARVKIDHPGIPEAIRQIAAEAVQGIWQAASAAAVGSLAEVRADVERRAQDADEQRQQTQTALDYARREIAVGAQKLEKAAQEFNEAQESLHAERAAHAATAARLQEMRHQVEERDRQLAEARAQFSAELEHARGQVSLARERAAAAERHVMLELDHERTARQRSERAADALRAELGAARTELKEAAVRLANVETRLQTEFHGLSQRLAVADAERTQHAGELAGVHQELAETLRRAERAETEVEVTRRLLAELKKGPVRKSAR
jgi:chromosome segregation ATPase